MGSNLFIIKMIRLSKKLISIRKPQVQIFSFSNLNKPNSEQPDDLQVKKFERKNKSTEGFQQLRRRVTKEDMKMEMLNEDHFDTESIKDGMQRREEREDFHIT